SSSTSSNSSKLLVLVLVLLLLVLLLLLLAPLWQQRLPTERLAVKNPPVRQLLDALSPVDHHLPVLRGRHRVVAPLRCGRLLAQQLPAPARRVQLPQVVVHAVLVHSPEQE